MMIFQLHHLQTTTRIASGDILEVVQEGLFSLDFLWIIQL